MFVLIIDDMMPFDAVPAPKPMLPNDLSGLTWRTPSDVSGPKICGVTLYPYSMELTYWSMSDSPESKYPFSDARSLLPMLSNVFAIIFDSCTGLLESPSSDDWLPEDASVESPDPSAPSPIMLVMSKPWSWICSGYSESVFSSTLAM